MTEKSLLSTLILVAILAIVAILSFRFAGIVRQILSLRTSVQLGKYSKSAITPHFNIAQVTINEHGPIFEEIIISLQAAFNELNLHCTRSENVFVDGAINVVIGATMFVCEQVAAALAGKTYVLYQMEQLDKDSGFLPNFPEYIKLMNSASYVWDYSLSNIKLLTQMGVTNTIHVPVGFHATIEVLQHDLPKDIDVLFYGSSAPRRDFILRALTEQGMVVKTLFGCYGKERDSAIARSKIVLNIHRTEINTLEEVRLSYLLANHCFVISENADHNPYGNGVVFCPYDQLVETCRHYLQVEGEERQRIAEAGYQAICSVVYTDYIKQAVQQTLLQDSGKLITQLIDPE